MVWKIELSARARKALKKLDRKPARDIVRALEEIAQLQNPRSRGKALTGNLQGLWRYRVGDYRVICDIRSKQLTIYAIDLGHRRNIYQL
ncbi:MAG: type II toxin-antitoxin system RelE/ParE family toxin [Varibaculum cambriense]|uniref:type II toxin-antitoxin system RelE family toxin n=1 Tax=Varibaculum cambriense TaxID=184870 RepID=UPI0029017765|nr:type II toxin-antitoxin system RelE/ParE family toxin [Varibaculum cambriense]MDU1051576.1 type II toxin-antitoxin system RelE/ParE family toxin [Varibaculum cambriense]